MAETEGIKKATRPKKRPPEPTASVSSGLTEGLGEGNETQAATEGAGTDAFLGGGTSIETEEPKRGRGRPPGSTKLKLVEQALPTVSITPEEAGTVIDVIGAFKVWVAQRMGYPPEIAAILGYSPEQRAYLAEPTAKILEKWLPKTMGRFKDEIGLLFAFYVVESQKFSEMNAAADKLKAQAALMNGAAVSERAA